MQPGTHSALGIRGPGCTVPTSPHPAPSNKGKSSGSVRTLPMETHRSCEFELIPTMVSGVKGVCPSGQGISAWPTASVPHLQGREQEVIQAPCVDRGHHITDQVDLGSQVLDSGEPPPPQREGKGDLSGTGIQQPGRSSGLGGWTPGPCSEFGPHRTLGGPLWASASPCVP